MPRIKKERPNCIECGKKVKLMVHKFCSRDCFHRNFGRNHTDAGSPRWKGGTVGYHGIHKWLTRVYGKGTICDHCKNAKKLHWAKLTDKPYERVRENFIQLCASCHKKYDMTDEVRKKMSISHIGLPSSRKGIRLTAATRDKISTSLKKYFHKVG